MYLNIPAARFEPLKVRLNEPKAFAAELATPIAIDDATGLYTCVSMFMCMCMYIRISVWLRFVRP